MLFPENYKPRSADDPNPGFNKFTTPAFLAVDIQTGEILVNRLAEVYFDIPDNHLLTRRGKRIENRMPAGPGPAEP